MLALFFAAATASPLSDDARLGCTFYAVGQPAATTLDVNLKARRATNAMLSFGRDSRFAGVTATSVATRQPDGSTVIGFAIGTAQYRAAFTPVRDGAMLRIDGVGGRDSRVGVAQGFCNARGTRRVGGRVPLVLPIAPGRAEPSWRLLPMPGRLSEGMCRIVSRDRRTFQMRYSVAAAQANEVTVAYTFVTSDRGGANVQTGSGTQFYLTAPGERMIATTVSLGASTPTYVHTTYERSGAFVDLSRDGHVFAAGECGASPGWIGGGR